MTRLFLLFITMLLKTVVDYYVLRWQGVEKEEAYVAGAVLAQVGEFFFILAAMGLVANIIDTDGRIKFGGIIGAHSKSVMCTIL